MLQGPFHILAVPRENMFLFTSTNLKFFGETTWNIARHVFVIESSLDMFRSFEYMKSSYSSSGNYSIVYHVVPWKHISCPALFPLILFLEVPISCRLPFSLSIQCRVRVSFNVLWLWVYMQFSWVNKSTSVCYICTGDTMSHPTVLLQWWWSVFARLICPIFVVHTISSFTSCMYN